MDESRSAVLKWLIAVILSLSQISVGWSITAVNIAIPTMMASLAVSLNEIHWVLTGFLITRTIMMPTVGWFGSRFSDRKIFILFTGVFVLGSFLCAVAWDSNSLIFARLIQATGAGPLVAIGMAIMFESFPAHQRGLALGIFSASWSVAPYIGPPLGGLLVESVHWRAIFYFNVLVGSANILGAYLLFPNKTPNTKGSRFDFPGFLTFSAASVTLLLALSKGQELGWTSPEIASLFALSAVLTSLFVAIELKVQDPFMQLRCFKNRIFSIVTFINFFRVFAFRGANFLVSLVLQKGLNYTPFQAGLLLLPGIIGTSIFAPLAGAVSDRFGPRTPIIAGFAIMALGAYGFSTVSLWTTAAALFLFISLQSVGQACINAPLNSVGLRASPEGKTKMASGILAMSRSLGESFGIAVLSFLLEVRVFLNVSSMALSEAAGSATGPYYDVLAELKRALIQAGDYAAGLHVHAHSFLSYTLLTEALAESYRDLFGLIMILYILLLAISVVIFRSYARNPLPSR